MPKHKFKKFKRSEEELKLRLGNDELQIVQDLADYQLLDTEQIIALNPKLSKRTAQRKLQLLFHAGLLERPIAPSSKYAPSDNFIYSLADKGVKQVFGGRKIPSFWADEKESPRLFAHRFMISNFRAVLTLALRGQKQTKITRWQNNDIKESILVEGERLPLRPDGFFTIEDKDDLMHFFLEADRSNMEHSRFLDKLRAYWHFWKEQKCQKLGIKTFRVLTITISDQRKNNLAKDSKRADPQEIGSNIFWFACEKSYNLQNPNSILKSIWQTPKNDGVHHLLE